MLIDNSLNNWTHTQLKINFKYISSILQNISKNNLLNKINIIWNSRILFQCILVYKFKYKIVGRKKSNYILHSKFHK